MEITGPLRGPNPILTEGWTRLPGIARRALTLPTRPRLPRLESVFPSLVQSPPDVRKLDSLRERPLAVAEAYAITDFREEPEKGPTVIREEPVFLLDDPN